MSQSDSPEMNEVLETSSLVSHTSGRQPLFVLIAGFVVAFGAACVLALLIGHYTVKAPRSFIPSFFSSSGVVRTPDVIAEPFSVATAGAFIKARGGEKLNPIQGEDYVVFVWLRLRRVPAPRETLGIISKFDAHVANKPGYALSLEGAPDGVRPKVYLSSGSTEGRWFTFTAHPMVRGEWYLVAFSISQDSFVSARIAQAGQDHQHSFLGGYEMRLPALPLSASDVSVGSIGSSRFRGQIGPFGVLSAPKLQEGIGDLVSQMQTNPHSIPSGVREREVVLWASPFKDLGPSDFQMEQGVLADPQVAAPAANGKKLAGNSKQRDKHQKLSKVKVNKAVASKGSKNR